MCVQLCTIEWVSVRSTCNRSSLLRLAILGQEAVVELDQPRCHLLRLFLLHQERCPEVQRALRLRAKPGTSAQQPPAATLSYSCCWGCACTGEQIQSSKPVWSKPSLAQAEPAARGRVQAAEPSKKMMTKDVNS